MQHYSTLQLKDYNTIRTNKKIEYLNIESAFDIETSSIYVGSEKSAFMYIWMFGIGYDEPVYYGRTWEEFQELTDTLCDKLQLNRDKRLVIYVHNLSYEFQFMRKYFDWLQVFAISERKPIKAVTTSGIEFRDSYILSGYSLAKTAENLQTHRVEKMVGDLDYSLTRHHKTELTLEEIGYCKNDIEVVNAYINEQIEQYSDISKIPMTNTGRVRTFVRNNCYYTSTNHRKTNKGKYTRYRKIMNDLTLEPDDYKQLKRAFMGGFTHANANYVGKTLNNVTSIDFTSSYPASMLAEKYPMSRPFKVEPKTVKEFEDLCSKYAMVFDIEFHNLRPRIYQDNYLSESKAIKLEKPIINNGRIFSADMVGTTLTEVDYSIMKQSYKWDSISVGNVKAHHKNYLPKDIIKSILELYQGKTELKGVEGSEVEYLLSKGMLNSIYGMSVTDVVKHEHIFEENEWSLKLVDVDDKITEYNEKKNRFLYYPWGVWITAYARFNLWTGIISIEHDYIYSDTDSIKLLNADRHQPYFEAYNENVMNKLLAMMKHYKLDPSLLSPKTIQGIEKPIGVWDFEGNYERFKTLGSKRYLLQEDDQLELTVAGLSKRNGLNYMIKQANGNIEQVFKDFTDELYIPAMETGKNTHTYVDQDYKLLVTDYLGNTETVITLSGVHLTEADYTLSISKQYGEFLRNLKQGYIYRGEKKQ